MKRRYILDEVAWRKDAACKNVPVEVFYPSSTQNIAPAKAICAECRVRQDCLDFALDNGEEHGVWGGLGEDERRRHKRREREGRVA